MKFLLNENVAFEVRTQFPVWKQKLSENTEGFSVPSFSLKFRRILCSRVVKLYEASKRTSDAVEYQHIYEQIPEEDEWYLESIIVEYFFGISEHP